MGKWKNNISFKKDTEKVVLLTVKGLIQVIVKLKAEKNCACQYSALYMPQTSIEEHRILRTKTIVQQSFPNENF